jgi:hypothetical protein
MRVVLGQFSGHDVLFFWFDVDRIRDRNIRRAPRPEILYDHISLMPAAPQPGTFAAPPNHAMAGPNRYF